MTGMRRLWRMLLVIRHLGEAVWKLSVLSSRWDEARRAHENSAWSRRAIGIFGGQVRQVAGLTPTTGEAVLLVANHVSWLDIYAVMSVTDCRFVAKADVRRWPVIGWLAARLGTVFVAREQIRDVAKAGRTVSLALAEGQRMCVFPEGTTTDGSRVYAFNSALLQPAISTGAVVQPVAIRYLQLDGAPFPNAAFVGDMTLVASLWQLTATQGFIVELAFLEPIATHDKDRREVAALASRQIAAYLDVPCIARPPIGAGKCPPQASPVDWADVTPGFWTR